MTESPLLSAEEIRRRLSAILNSDPIDKFARRTPGLSTIAKRANQSRNYMYLLCYGHRVPNLETRQKLSEALKDINV